MKKTIIIAEAGVNHNGDIELAKKLIKVAAESGADYVKFQLFNSNALVTSDAKKADYQIKNSTASEKQLEMIKGLELNYDQFQKLVLFAKKSKIKILASAFDIESLKFLISLNMDFLKIASGEITNLPLLKVAANSNKKIILSTGMSTLLDI